jgi:L-arabinokinase
LPATPSRGLVSIMLDTVTFADPDALVGAVETGLDGAFDTARRRIVARAPGRLDVMGGIADTTGSRLVAAALHAGAVVAAQPADDPRLRCLVLDPRTHEVIEDIRTLLPNPAGGHAAARAAFDELACPPFSAVRCVLAGILARRAQAGTQFVGPAGWTVAVSNPVPIGGGAGALAAIQVALARCLGALEAMELDPSSIVRTCREAQARFFDLPIGPLDPIVSLHGRPHDLIQFAAGADAVVEPLAAPEGTRFVGIDSQKRHDRAADKYRDVFASAAMGRRIIEAVIRQDPRGSGTTLRNLADIQPAEFVDRFRDTLPTRLRGRDYVRQFGENAVDGHRIDESAVYKIRSRVEHHVYENQRVHEFVATLVRARNNGTADALQHAGELMYSSHWSYGQRCGLGSVETDLLVNRLRQQGVARGIYGARVSGGGAGGMVTVFCADSAAAREAMDRVLDDYRARTGLDPVIHETGGEGALRVPVRRID